MPPLDIAFHAALLMAAFAAGFGGRAALALVLSNVFLSGIAIMVGLFAPILWLLVDLAVILAIVVPDIVRWQRLTACHLAICALFPVAWYFYFTTNHHDPREFVMMTRATTVVATAQLVLSLPWRLAFYWAREKLWKLPTPPSAFFDERLPA